MNDPASPPGYSKLVVIFGASAIFHGVLSFSVMIVISFYTDYVLSQPVIFGLLIIYALMATSAFTLGMVLLTIIPKMFNLARSSIIEVKQSSEQLVLALEATRHGQSHYSISIR